MNHRFGTDDNNLTIKNRQISNKIIKNNIKINQIRLGLIMIVKLLNNLKDIRLKMIQHSKLMSSVEWNTLIGEITTIKTDLNKRIQLIESNYTKILTKIKKRTMKRKRYRFKNELESIINLKRQELDEKITESLYNTNEKILQKQKLLEDNKAINIELKSVVKRKNKAKNMIEVLNGLKELRNVRKNVTVCKEKVGENEFLEKIGKL